MPFPLHFISHSKEINEEITKKKKSMKTKTHKEQNPNHKDRKNKPNRRWQRRRRRWLNPSGEGSRWRWQGLLMFLSRSLGGFLDSCSWFSLGLWVSWFLILDVCWVLRELVSWFLMFLSWCCQQMWESERQREHGWEIKSVRLDFNLNETEFNLLEFCTPKSSLLHSRC